MTQLISFLYQQSSRAQAIIWYVECGLDAITRKSNYFASALFDNIG
jgi:hypothetical protein